MKKVGRINFYLPFDCLRQRMSWWLYNKAPDMAPMGRTLRAIAAVLALAGLAVYAWPAQAMDRTVGKRSGVAIHRDWMNPHWSLHKRIADLMLHITAKKQWNPQSGVCNGHFLCSVVL